MRQILRSARRIRKFQRIGNCLPFPLHRRHFQRAMHRRLMRQSASEKSHPGKTAGQAPVHFWNLFRGQ
jgi:hypothetical protein